MSKYKRLVNNSIVFTIGSFGSKLINFFMVPLYTNVLSTSEYGIVDLIISTTSLLVPFFTLALGHAALRLTIDAKNEKEKLEIFNVISIHGIIATVLILIFSPMILNFLNFENLGKYFILLLILNTFNDLYSQYVRGIGLIKQFAVNGILMTIATVTMNILLLLKYSLGMSGYIVSLLIAVFISNLYLLSAIRRKIKIKLSSFNKYLYIDMLKFSIPIIPNTLMWWLINGSTRYFVLFFVGATGNGLLAVANKIPSIISMATNIFTQAWQISSFEEYESNDNNKFQTIIFGLYSSFLFLSGSFIIVILKPLLSFIIDSSFYESWQIVPFLVIAVIYQSFSSFLGTNYTASKSTKGTFTTSVYGGIISLISSIILIPKAGVIGAGLSTALSFIGMFIFRAIDTRKFVEISIDKIKFIGSNTIIILQTLILFIFNGLFLALFQVILFLILLVINFDIIKMLLNKLFNK
ncbi:lipopolysaccharide biosynthesis protein [Aerococcus urinaeequi]|uniref:lipopolysaccharide biosynthesis protein n=1 Tax=Aerococcus urinaeequi TaxID=51665 RepID=UPI003D6A533E